MEGIQLTPEALASNGLYVDHSYGTPTSASAMCDAIDPPPVEHEHDIGGEGVQEDTRPLCTCTTAQIAAGGCECGGR